MRDSDALTTVEISMARYPTAIHDCAVTCVMTRVTGTIQEALGVFVVRIHVPRFKLKCRISRPAYLHTCACYLVLIDTRR